MKLSGNTLLITGATSGIGLALARRFHALGNNIIAVGQNREKLLQMEGEMDDLTGIACDIGDHAQLELLMDRVRREHPRMNVLINSADVQYNYAFDDADRTKVEHEIDVNFHANVRLCQGLLPMLHSQTRAAIVNVGSLRLGLAETDAHRASSPVHFATKAAVHAFTQSLRHQLADSKVRVFELIPQRLDTPPTEGSQAEKAIAETVVDAFLMAFRKEVFEVHVGRTGVLRRMLNMWPSAGHRMPKLS